jgi:hypothetical protein
MDDHLLLRRERDAEWANRLRLAAVVHELELRAGKARPDVVRIQERVLRVLRPEGVRLWC